MSYWRSRAWTGDSLKIVCSGYIVRHPLGGHIWHHLQYLVGLKRLGHDVIYFEDYGLPYFCYDPIRNDWTSDPTYGIDYLRMLLRPHGLDESWAYLAEDGVTYGMPRSVLRDHCREADLYLNLSNINWIPEVELCRKRALVDTDPVFTQIGAHGLGGPFERYDILFTYGENVHKPSSQMPTAGQQWFGTRQPVVLDLWPVIPGDPAAPLTTVMNWSAFGDKVHQGRTYGQKDREFERFFNLPRTTGTEMEVAVSVPDAVRERLRNGGWNIREPREVTLTPDRYQLYLQQSRGEFCVAKHAYVSTWCGWFSDRSTAYLASGRPVVIQDTGFSEWLPVGAGVLGFRTCDEAIAGIAEVTANYGFHSAAARRIVTEHFRAERVLSEMIEHTFATQSTSTK